MTKSRSTASADAQVARKPAERGDHPLFERSLNGTGYTINSLDEVSQDFVDFAATVAPEQVVDVGAGFGTATLAVLDRGGSVIANDVERGHLDQIDSRTDAAARSRLSLMTGRFPDEVTIPDGSVAGVLLSRVLHFFDGPQVERSAATLARWLRRGGKVFVVCESSLFLSAPQLRRVYERQRSRGEKWPGFVRGVHALLPHRAEFVPDQLHYLDADTLASVFRKAGFLVEAAELFRRETPSRGRAEQPRYCVKLIAKKT